MRTVLVCLGLLIGHAAAAESLEAFLRTFRQIPLDITAPDLLERYPGAKREGMLYLCPVAVPPFDQLVFQFHDDKLLAVMVAPHWGDPAATADWILRWADSVVQAAEAAWGPPEQLTVTPSGDALQTARYRWGAAGTRISLEFTTPASLRALGSPTTNRQVRFILARLPGNEPSRPSTGEGDAAGPGHGERRGL